MAISDLAPAPGGILRFEAVEVLRREKFRRDRAITELTGAAADVILRMRPPTPRSSPTG